MKQLTNRSFLAVVLLLPVGCRWDSAKHEAASEQVIASPLLDGRGSSSISPNLCNTSRSLSRSTDFLVLIKNAAPIIATFAAILSGFMPRKGGGDGSPSGFVGR